MKSADKTEEQTSVHLSYASFFSIVSLGVQEIRIRSVNSIRIFFICCFLVYFYIKFLESFK